MSFSVTGGMTMVGALVGTDCVTDWLTISCASNTITTQQTGGAVCVDRICGMVFNSEAAAASTPSVPVYSKFWDTLHSWTGKKLMGNLGVPG